MAKVKEERKPISYTPTIYGLRWGSAEIQRFWSDAKTGKIILRIQTPKHIDGLQISVSKTGKVRVYNEGKEWKPEVKDVE